MRKERKGKVLQQVENFEIYKGCLLRTKENFSLVMLIKGKFSKQHDNFEIYKDCLLWKKENLKIVFYKFEHRNEKGKIMQQFENFEIYKGCLLRTKRKFHPCNAY